MKTIKIPKVDSPVWVEIKKTQTTKYRFVLKKQEIEGIVIPNDSTIDIESDMCEFNSNGTKVEIPVNRINRLLRFVYLDMLREGKI